MLKQVVLSFLFLGLSSGQEKSLMEIRDTINTWNWDVKCWGEQNVLKQRLWEKRSCEHCMQLPTEPLVTGQFVQSNLRSYSFPLQPASLPTNFLQTPANKIAYVNPYLNNLVYRGKRQAYASNNNIQEFLEDVEDFTHLWDSKLSNLTCVLKTMGIISADFTLNRALFETEYFKTLDLSATENLADPVWRQKTSGMWTDCIDMSNSVPQSHIDNNPVSRRYGPIARCMIFMKCFKMSNKKMCGSAQADKLIQKLHGYDLNYIDASKYGIRDKYEKAMMAAMVIMESKSPEMEFTEEFFHGE